MMSEKSDQRKIVAPKSDVVGADSLPQLPVEIEIFVEADGSVTFADLAEGTLPVVAALNPDQSLACEPSVPEDSDSGAS